MKQRERDLIDNSEEIAAQEKIAHALEVLGLGPTMLEDEAAINAAWKRTARTVHPDVCHGTEAKRLMLLATAARDTLLR